MIPAEPPMPPPFHQNNYPRSFTHYQRLASRSNAYALYFRGCCHSSGQGTRPNPSKAVRCLKLAVKHGCTEAHFRLGWHYEFGIGASVNLNEAARHYRLAANRGNELAHWNFALCLEHGKGVAIDLASAAMHYKQSADGGHVPAQWRYAVFAQMGMGIRKDERAAFEYYQRASDHGHVMASHAYVECIEEGIGVPANPVAVAAMIKRMAEADDDPWALFKYAQYLEAGKGMEIDMAKAEQFYQRAADRGCFEAQWKCGVEILVQRKNLAEGVRCLEMAANASCPEADFQLGICFAQGDGTRKDRSEAKKRMQKASQRRFEVADLAVWFLNAE